ncbi:2258_t:CDS:2 [Paraglomus brasilianum]|uniref:2258_t:CDS:1 n=1 Tax=Paraglomus brasilianum TaxID=144538 RepID=A0A9N9B2C8_9GLOM|nr:2258_t:CDS:2 [Paraglomus brasilianum]
MGDKELAVKLEDELKYEKAETVDPKFIKNFLENNPFKQQEVPEEEVQPRLKFPYRCSITVEKDNKGALAFDTVIDDGALLIEHVAFFADGSLVDGTSSEAEWKRRSIYNGPTYDTLDDDIQRLFDAYLQERGITASVALFIPSYAEYKEQQEYIKWIERLRNFLDG